MIRVLKPTGQLIIADFMTENRAQRTDLEQQFRQEGREDMVQELDDEDFTYISVAKNYFQGHGYEVSYERGSTLSWVFVVSCAPDN